jgi:DNA adenine methylase
MFSRADFARLAALLRGIKGRFILSINDRAEVRKIFADFNLEAVRTTYTIAGKLGGGKPEAEQVITGGGRRRG